MKKIEKKVTKKEKSKKPYHEINNGKKTRKINEK